MIRYRLLRGAALALPAILASGPAFAATTPLRIDSGDTAWMLASTALVLMMTIPGLALFYAGMVRKKNVLATMMQSFTVCCLVTIVWMVAGYSLAFTNGTPYIGDFSRFFLQGLGANWDKPFAIGAGLSNATQTTIPETVYMMFQMTFAIIAPALIAGAFADRMKFSALLVFMTLVAAGLFPDRPLGLERDGLAWSRRIRPARRGGFRRWHRGAYQCRDCRSDVRPGPRPPGRLRT
jgi:Amt family ammonium transporter